MKFAARRPAIVASCVLMCACHSWKPTSAVTPEQAIDRANGADVRVTTKAGAIFELDHARFENDSVVGDNEGTRTAIASDQISEVEISTLDPKKQAFVVWQVLMGALLLVLLSGVIGWAQDG